MTAEITVQENTDETTARCSRDSAIEIADLIGRAPRPSG
jgi:hypothetical protein